MNGLWAIYFMYAGFTLGLVIKTIYENLFTKPFNASLQNYLAFSEYVMKAKIY